MLHGARAEAWGLPPFALSYHPPEMFVEHTYFRPPLRSD